MMRRRQFITLLGGAAAVGCPLAVSGQQGGSMRRIGWLFGGAENDRARQADLAELRESLAKLGWSEGRNLRIDYRWGVGDNDRHRANAAESSRPARTAKP